MLARDGQLLRSGVAAEHFVADALALHPGFVVAWIDNSLVEDVLVRVVADVADKLPALAGNALPALVAVASGAVKSFVPAANAPDFAVAGGAATKSLVSAQDALGLVGADVSYYALAAGGFGLVAASSVLVVSVLVAANEPVPAPDVA